MGTITTRAGYEVVGVVGATVVGHGMGGLGLRLVCLGVLAACRVLGPAGGGGFN